MPEFPPVPPGAFAVDRPGARLLAHLDRLLRDHGFFRAVRLNLHEFAPGLWRSAQPAPGHLRRLHRRTGLRTVVNLRGPNPYGSYALEVATCRELGIELVNHPARSRDAPERDFILGWIDLLARAPRPLLLHCKSGADRAGLAAAIALLHHGRPVAEAAAALALRYGHIRAGPTGILDAFVAAYAAAHAATGQTFAAWVETTYDPAALRLAFAAQPWGRALTDWVLRRE